MLEKKVEPEVQLNPLCRWLGHVNQHVRLIDLGDSK